MPGKPEKTKLTLFTTRRLDGNEDPGSPRSPVPSSVAKTPPVLARAKSNADLKSNGAGGSRQSIEGLRELVQCALCLEQLCRPKMLPCQHTFCSRCLTVYVAEQESFNCPICRLKIQVTSDRFIKNLPTNLYTESIISLFGNSKEPRSKSPVNITKTDARETDGLKSNVNKDKNLKSDVKETKTQKAGDKKENAAQSVELFAAGVKCHLCQSVCDHLDVTSCEHCKLNFCTVCWSMHLAALDSLTRGLLTQLDAATDKLIHTLKYSKDHYEILLTQINTAAEEKMKKISEEKQQMQQEVERVKLEGEHVAEILLERLRKTKEETEDVVNDRKSENEEIAKFVSLHQSTSSLLAEVSRWDVGKLMFDKNKFRLEKDRAPSLIHDDYYDDEFVGELDVKKNQDNLYRGRNWVPALNWNRVSRPGGMGVCPWQQRLYVCAPDARNVLVLIRMPSQKLHVAERLSSEHMMHPAHVAFMESTREVYVTDKWKHCIHVFSDQGAYLRSIGSRGSRVGLLRSPEGVAVDDEKQLIYVADTGNDRVQIFQPDGQTAGTVGVGAQQANKGSMTACTELNAPTDVAVFEEKLIVLDSGNRRVKIYNKNDKGKISEFGSLGQRKGQFRQPEVLAVDSTGNILVGDSGNSRVQIFRPSGQVIKAFGDAGTELGHFGWVSGLCVSEQFEIIVSDNRNNCINFY